MQSHSVPRTSSRSRRASLAAAVLIFHGVAIELLLATRHDAQRPPEKSQPLQITLLPRADDPRAQGPSAAPALFSPRTFDNAPQLPLTLPNITLPDTPAVDSAAQTVMRNYLGCHLKEGSGLSTEERQRCEKMLALPVGPEGLQKQTEEELRLARTFAKERARREAAVRVPCVSATVLDVMCLLNLATGGSDSFMDTYATAGAKGLNSNSGATSLGIRPGGGRAKNGAK